MDDSLPIPPRRRIDANFVSDIVGQPIINFILADGAKKGDNVIAKLITLRVETDTGAFLDVIIKSLVPFSGEWDPATKKESLFFISFFAEVFPTEMEFYTRVRPLLQEITDYPCNTPEFFAGRADGLEAFIALEDVRPKGFKMADLRKGLTVGELTSTLEKLALLHAHSYAILQQGNPIMEQIKKSPLKDHPWTRILKDMNQEVFFSQVIRKMVEVMREIGEVATAVKMERFINTGYQIILDLRKKTGQSSKYFEVILHGDMWANNVLFKYAPDGITVQDLAFIDYQQCRFGTIYEDLLYLVITSTTAEFRKLYLKQCLPSYFKAFQMTLASLKTPLPLGFTEDELIFTMYEHLEYAFVYEVIALPFQLALGNAKAPPQDNETKMTSSPAEEQQHSYSGQMAVGMTICEMLKQATKSSPLAVQRLKELCAEMIELNVL